MLIILDRDGVINEDSDQYIKSPAEWIAIPGSLRAIAELNRAGHQVVIASNQSGIGRGYYTLETLNAIHKKMLAQLKEHGGKIDGIYFCPHHPNEKCHCRKPKTGLLQKIAQDFKSIFHDAIMIGDSISDFYTAQAMQLKFVLVLTGKGQKTLTHYQSQLSHIVFANHLEDATHQILKN